MLRQYPAKHEILALTPYENKGFLGSWFEDVPKFATKLRISQLDLGFRGPGNRRLRHRGQLAPTGLPQ